MLSLLWVDCLCNTIMVKHHIVLNFRRSLISRILWIFNHSRKISMKNFWDTVCSVRVQRICKIISTNSSQIAIHKNLDPRKFSTIRYAVYIIIEHCEGWLFSSGQSAGSSSKGALDSDLSGSYFLFTSYHQMCVFQLRQRVLILSSLRPTRRTFLHSRCRTNFTPATPTLTSVEDGPTISWTSL